MFAPLSPPTIERLAARLVAVDAPIGTWLIREGEPGDRYFVIDAGTAAVSIGGRVVRVLSPGDGFGEISLLRNVPRTASVRATSDVSLFGLDRSVFLAALTGQAQARSAADALVSDRLESAATELSTAEAPAEPA